MTNNIVSGVPLGFHPAKTASKTRRRGFSVTAPRGRQKVSNGSEIWLGAVDGRTTLARRVRDLLADLQSDLAGHGNLSTAQRGLMLLAATCQAEVEQYLAQIAAGTAVDRDEYERCVSRLLRVLAALFPKNLARQPKLVEPKEHDGQAGRFVAEIERKIRAANRTPNAAVIIDQPVTAAEETTLGPSLSGPQGFEKAGAAMPRVSIRQTAAVAP